MMQAADATRLASATQRSQRVRKGVGLYGVDPQLHAPRVEKSTDTHTARSTAGRWGWRAVATAIRLSRERERMNGIVSTAELGRETGARC